MEDSRERDDGFAAVSEYIHLNPVRARLVASPKWALKSYRWSSYPRFVGVGALPPWQTRGLAAVGGLPSFSRR